MAVSCQQTTIFSSANPTYELREILDKLMKAIITLKKVSLLIIFIGLCLAVLSDKSAVTITLLTLGICMFILNELLPKLEGRFEIGPNGFIGTLASARRVDNNSNALQKHDQTSPLATLTLPELQIKGGAQSAEVSWSGMGNSPPFKLTEAGNFSLTVDYVIPNGEKFQVTVPIKFHQAR